MALILKKPQGIESVDFKKYFVTYAACALLTGGAAAARPPDQHSGSECHLNGHRMYVPAGLNYPRHAWASWGISCPSTKPEGQGPETTADSSGRPAEWCGWWMRQHLGGHFGPEYNVARNW